MVREYEYMRVSQVILRCSCVWSLFAYDALPLCVTRMSCVQLLR
jgi:hypothetical protein